MKRPPKRQGEAAEIEFLCRATRLGFRLSKPYGESDAYDFILDNGRQLHRVQVKSTACFHHGCYSVQTHFGRSRLPYDARCLDFIIVWIEPLDAWYVVPIAYLRGACRISFFPQRSHSRGRFERFRNAWHLLMTTES